VHYGRAAATHAQRAQVLADVFTRYPERFPNGRPWPKAAPSAVWINPPAKAATAQRL
jgi:putative transposase